MVDNRLLQFLFTLGFIALVSFSTYKVSLYLALKIIELCLKSHRFSASVSLFLAVVFYALGIFQVKVFVETGPYLSRFFPLSFISSGLMMFVGFRNYKCIK